MDDRGAFVRIDEGMDEDVGKLRKMMQGSFPAFSAWPQIFGGVASPAESDEQAHAQEKAAAEGGAEGEEEDEGPLMLGGAGFTAPKFTPFPPANPSARRAAPPTKRQSWTSRGGSGGGEGGAAGAGGGRRKKK